MSPIRKNPNIAGLRLMATSADDPWAPITDALDHALSAHNLDELTALAFVAGEMAASGAPSAAKPLLQALQLYTHPKTHPNLRDFHIGPDELLDVISADDPPRSVLGADVQLAASQLAKSHNDPDLAMHLVELALSTYRYHHDTIGIGIARHALADALSESGQRLAAMREYRAAARQYARAADQNGQAAALINAISEALEVGDRVGGLRDASALARLDLTDAHLRASSLRSRARSLIAAGREEEARPLLLDALRSCRHRGDPELEVVVLQDLAILTEATRGYKQASHWWAQANRKCTEYGLTSRRFAIAHGLALNYYRIGDLETAIATLKGALATQDDADMNTYSVAESDLAGIELESALDAWRQSGDVDSDSLTSISARLMHVFDFLIAHEDLPEASRALHNFVILCKIMPDGCERLNDAHLKATANPGLSESLNQDLAIAGIACGLNWGLAWLGDMDQADEPDVLALHLAEAAIESSSVWGNDEGGLRLFDATIRYLTDRPDSNSAGDILNSRGLLLAELDRQDDAMDSLREALLHAEHAENRVLQAMVLYNLGEMKLRLGDIEAPDYFNRSERLARDVGDFEQAAEASLGAARWYIGNGDIDRARECMSRAGDLVGRTESSALRGALKSKEASLAYARGSYATAHRLWRSALVLSRTPEVATFSLDALARMGKEHQFRIELERELELWQEPESEIEFAKGLLRSVHSWSSQNLEITARTLAYAQILSGNGAVHSPKRSNASSGYLHAIAVASACTMTFDELASEHDPEFQEFFRSALASIAHDEEGEAAVLQLMEVLRTLGAKSED